MSQPKRAAMYLRVSTGEQTVENQRRVLDEVAQRRGWTVVKIFEDNGISGARGREDRPGFDAMLKGAERRAFDVLMVWSIDRLGRSTAMVTTALEELAAAGVAIYADRESMDTSTPHGRAMLQMAAVFGELERGMIRERVLAGVRRAQAAGKHCGRPRMQGEVEMAVRRQLVAGMGQMRIARELGCSAGYVNKVAKAMRAAAAVAKPSPL